MRKEVGSAMQESVAAKRRRALRAPLFEGFGPFTAGSREVDRASYRIMPFVRTNLFGWTQTISFSELSSGDRATDYNALLCGTARPTAPVAGQK